MKLDNGGSTELISAPEGFDILNSNSKLYIGKHSYRPPKLNM